MAARKGILWTCRSGNSTSGGGAAHIGHGACGSAANRNVRKTIKTNPRPWAHSPWPFFVVERTEEGKGKRNHGQNGTEDPDGKRGDRPRPRRGGVHAGGRLSGDAGLGDPLFGCRLRQGDGRGAPHGVVGKRKSRLRDGACQQHGRAALGGGDEAGGAERRGRPLHPRDLPRRQGRIHPDCRGRPGTAKLADGAGQPPVRPLRQGAGLRSLLAPGGAGDGGRGLRAFGEVRDPGHPPADDPRLPRPSERRLPPAAVPGTEGALRKEPRPVGGHAAVPHRTPPPPERKARPDRRGAGLRPDAHRRRRFPSADLHRRLRRLPSPTPANFSTPWVRRAGSISTRSASPIRSTSRSSGRSGSATRRSSSWRRRTA